MPSAVDPLDPLEAAHGTPACSIQILLFTYQPNVLADDIFQSAAHLALNQPGVQVVVAWGGQESPRQEQWVRDVARYQALGADVVLVSHPSGLERTRQALAMPHDWVLPLADDDPIAVNYLRAMTRATMQADADVSGVLPTNQVQNCVEQTFSHRHTGWHHTDAESRQLHLLGRPGQWGTLFWGAYRHAVLSEWLDFALELPFQPSYLDQFLPHLAVCHGQLAITPEETILLKDERNWSDVAACTRTNARYCPHPDMALFHEAFWAADMWHLLAPRIDSPRIALAHKAWCRHMVDQMLRLFEPRAHILGQTIAPAHIHLLQRLRASCEWLYGADDPLTVSEDLARMQHDIQELRRQWLAEGQPPVSVNDARVDPFMATSDQDALACVC